MSTKYLQIQLFANLDLGKS